jgi:hypothetical protein
MRYSKPDESTKWSVHEKWKNEASRKDLGIEIALYDSSCSIGIHRRDDPLPSPRLSWLLIGSLGLKRIRV